MRYCTSCGAALLDGFRFCVQCGASVPVEKPVAAPVPEPVIEVSAAEPVSEPIAEVQAAEPVSEPIAEVPAAEMPDLDPEQFVRPACEPEQPASAPVTAAKEPTEPVSAPTEPKTDPAYTPPVYTAPATPPPASDNRHLLSFGGAFVALLLLCIPGVNLLTAFIWAIGGAKNHSRRNLSRAWLLLVFAVVLFFGCMALLIWLLAGDQIRALLAALEESFRSLDIMF